jgi:hypothetical protein
MDRRKSIKAIALGTLGTGVALESCKLMDKKEEGKSEQAGAAFTIDRAKEEKERDTALLNGKFFNEHEMATITVLADIIIPKDDVSGSASEAGVPAFIDFIVQDMPSHQTPLRGGLRWLDTQCLHRYGKTFNDSDSRQQMEMVDEIAWPDKAKPEMKQGVAFFNLMRNLTVTGFYTSEIGVKDLGYKGNVPNKWNGVPEEELKRLGLNYSEWEMNNCAKYDS